MDMKVYLILLYGCPDLNANLADIFIMRDPMLLLVPRMPPTHQLYTDTWTQITIHKSVTCYVYSVLSIWANAVAMTYQTKILIVA